MSPSKAPTQDAPGPPPDSASADPTAAHEEEYKQALKLALLCGIATASGFVGELVIGGDALPTFSLIAYLVAYAAGAWHAAQEVWELLRKRVLDIHFLMLCVAVGAAFIGHWWEGAMLLFLFSLSDALEDMSMARTEREIQSLFQATPKEATIVDEQGKESRVQVDKLAADMRVRVLPDEQFPADSEVLSGASAANESSLTGESAPVDKNPGDKVFSGTMNLWGTIDCRVIKPASESALAKIVTLIKEAQESKAPSQRFTDKFGGRYTVSLLTLCTLMFFVWWKGMGLPAFADDGEMTSAFYRAMTLLVVASPCALVLSIPSAILAGIASAAKRGVLFRGGAALEKLAEIKRVAMDKTGTLTTGIMALEKVESFPPGRETEVIVIAKALARNSAHPVSRAIQTASREHPAVEADVQMFESVAGLGVRGQIKLADSDSPNHQPALMGRRKLFLNAAWVEEIPQPDFGIIETLVECDGLRGRILLRDQVRLESAPLLARMRKQGLKTTMLTGDREFAARAVAEQLQLDDVRFELTPDEKVALVQKWADEGEKPAMIGDGVNDAPSIAAAHVGVAMGARGSDTALEQADVVLMQDKLENFYFAYELSCRARRIIRQNLAISVGVIVMLVIGALGASVPLTLGVIGHEGSTLIVVFNSLRLLFVKHGLADAQATPDPSEKLV